MKPSEGATPMARTNFENLRVYNLSEVLADEVWRIVRKWDAFSRDTVGKQLVRAADSIGANIAEGIGRGTCKDNRGFARNARGSLYETKHFLRRAFRRELIDEKATAHLKPIVDELAPKLNGYLRYLTKAVGASTVSGRRVTTNNYQLTTNDH
jgi:four helix bundle protein